MFLSTAFNPLALAFSYLVPSYYSILEYHTSSKVALVKKNPPANGGDRGDVGLILGLGRYSGGVHGNPLQYSCLENPLDRGAWRAVVHGVAKSWTQLKQMSMHMQ